MNYLRHIAGHADGDGFGRVVKFNSDAEIFLRGPISPEGITLSEVVLEVLRTIRIRVGDTKVINNETKHHTVRLVDEETRDSGRLMVTTRSQVLLEFLFGK